MRESRERLGRLIDDAWRRGEPTVFPALDTTPLRGMSIYAHVDHSVRLTRAVLALFDRGLYFESIPLIRMILESAVTAAWLAVTPGSGDSSLREATRLRRALFMEISKASADPLDSELKSIEADLAQLEEFKSAEAAKFENRCLSLEGGRWLYVVYRDLSSYSHAGALLLDHYLQEDPGPLGFAYVQDQDEGRAAVDLAKTVWLLHIALSAWDLVVPNEGRAAALTDVAEQSGFRSGIQRVVSHGPTD
jgi:hypothetical protein